MLTFMELQWSAGACVDRVRELPPEGAPRDFSALQELLSGVEKSQLQDAEDIALSWTYMVEDDAQFASFLSDGDPDQRLPAVRKVLPLLISALAKGPQ